MIEVFGSPEARAIHARYPAIDLHADSLMWSRWVGYDLMARHEAPLPWSALGGHVDVPRLREGGVGAQFFGLVSLPFLGQTTGLASVIHEQIDELERAVSRANGDLLQGKTADDVAAANRAGAVGALLGIEGAHSLEGDLDNLTRFAKRGVRYLGLAHFSANEAAFPAYGRGRNDDVGLTAFGRDVVSRCEELNVIVDLAHINRRGFFEACEMATRAPFVTHTGVLGVFGHWRNIGGDALRAFG